MTGATPSSPASSIPPIRWSTPAANTCTRWPPSSYHTLHGTQTVILDEDFTAPDGTVYTAGTPYEIDVAGRYWADFDRTSPIDAAVRAQAWTGVAHALIGQLGVGTVTASALQLGLGLAALFAGVGRNVPPHRRWPGVGNPTREGRGPGAANGKLDRIRAHGLNPSGAHPTREPVQADRLLLRSRATRSPGRFPRG